MGKNRLKPRVGSQGNHIQVPASPSDSDPELMPPKFCLRLMQSSHCITACTKDEKAAFATTLFQMSRLTWRALRQAPRHGQGYEQIERDSIRAGIPNSVSPDVKFIAFRFDGFKAIVGFRDASGVFNILWVDRDFTLYNHG